MSEDDSSRVSEFFVCRSRDVTPAATRPVARVLYARFSSAPAESELCAAVLSDSERDRACRFTREADRARFIQRRAFRRFCATTVPGWSRPLSRTDFSETEKGRPFLAELPGTWFSFSSSDSGCLGGWSPVHDLGVDLENQARKLEVVELARQYFSSAEASAVFGQDGPDRLRTFIQLWTFKEAALKSIGEGLPFGMDAFEFRLDPVPQVVKAPRVRGGAEPFRAYLVEGTGSRAALVTRSRTL